MAQGRDFSAYIIQGAAMLCFILLVICYIIFIAPLMWLNTEKNIAIGIYGILVVMDVLMLIRFSKIDPSDPKIIKLQHNFTREQNLSFLDHNWSICYLYANCCYPYDQSLCDKKGHQPIVEEEMMFCTVCKAEIGRLSKHCKACDKCIEGFDHHCWWLNRCVGKRNYNTFITMLAILFAILTLECLVGIIIIVRSIVDSNMTQDIHVKFGNQMTKNLVILITIIFTIIPLVISYPVGELIFFHLLLIKKGITTYDYIMGMRTQMEEKDISSTTKLNALETTPTKKNLVQISPWKLAKFNP